MNWVYKSYDELSKNELHDIMKTRIDVFVVEQVCPYPEIDGYDSQATHLWLEDEADHLVAYCRIFPSGVKYEEASIGRILVVKGRRGQGFAKELLQKALKVLEDEKAIKIQAQEYLLDFYKSFGFIGITESYLDDGIPHVDMVLQK